MLNSAFYLQPGKRKAKKMMRLWCNGSERAGDRALAEERLSALYPRLVPVFYGVAESTLEIFNKAVTAGKPWVYIDNQYFQTNRTKNYRVTWSALQHTGEGYSKGKKLARQTGRRGMTLGKWNKNGKHILVTLQSELYFQLLMPYTRQQWLTKVVKELKRHTDRPIVVREKPHPSRPYAQRIPFEKQLVDCYAIVTLNSATAIEGIMKGIPAFVTDPNCAIVPCANTRLADIEQPRVFDRMPWLELLADNQWSAKELEAGDAIRDLRERFDKFAPKDIVQRSYKLGDIR